MTKNELKKLAALLLANVFKGTEYPPHVISAAVCIYQTK